MTGASRSLRLAFAGTPQFAVPALDALHASRHEVLAVFTQADRGAGRGRVVQPGPVKQRAAELGLVVHQPATFRTPDARQQLAALQPDVFVVVAYGLILPPEALAIPRLGCLNIHASLLPRWRGAAPVQRAILAGDPATGVSIMRMEPGLDTGPVIVTGREPIGPADTADSLGERLAALGARLIVATLDRMADGDVVAVPQDPIGVTYAAKIDKAEALIDWRDDAAGIERKVRAFNPRPVAETRFRDAQLRIWEAEAVAAAAAGPAGMPEVPPGTVLGVTRAGIEVACGRGILRIHRLQAPGRKVVDAQQFASSVPVAGAQFGSP